MFNLSVKGKYGLLAVIELERYQQEGPIQIKSIAEAKNLTSIVPSHIKRVAVLVKPQNNFIEKIRDEGILGC